MTIKILSKANEEIIKQIREVEIICKDYDKTTGSICIDASLNFYPEIKTLFLLYEDNKLISLISIFIPTASEAEISAYTLPEYRQKGYFRELLDEVIEELKKYKKPELVFVCEPGSIDGKKVVKKLGAKLCFTEHFLRFKSSAGNLKLKRCTQIKLQEADLKDIEPIVTLSRQIFNNNYKDSKSMIEKSIKADNIIQYTALLDEHLIGMAAVSSETGQASIFGLGISPKYQGKGFGKELMSLILEDLEKRGVKNITIEADSINKNALELYIKSGFEIETSYGYYKKICE